MKVAEKNISSLISFLTLFLSFPLFSLSLSLSLTLSLSLLLIAITLFLNHLVFQMLIAFLA